MLQWKTRFGLVVGNLALFASAIGIGEGFDLLHFGW